MEISADTDTVQDITKLVGKAQKGRESLVEHFLDSHKAP